MLTKEQVSLITNLVHKFMESEIKGWTELDNFMELLGFLDDDQLYREAEVLYSYHKHQKMGCPYNHEEGSVCFVTSILEAVDVITELYQEVGNLIPKHRYILEYYIGLCQDGQIILLNP